MTTTCQACGGLSQISNSRRTADNIRRRRECVKCGARWSTLEVTETSTRLDRIRGFRIPPERKAEYLKLVRKKGGKAREVAMAMGLTEDTKK